MKTGDEIEDKNAKIQILADKLMSLLPLVDEIMESMDEEDAVIIALGGNYDDTEDRTKTKTLNGLIELIKVRKEYREEMLQKQEEQKNRQEAINIFKAMGMF